MGTSTSETFSVTRSAEPRTRIALLLESIALRHLIAVLERSLIGQVHRGYTVSPAGSIIGFVWATPDGLIGGALLARLYNLISDWVG